MGRKVGISSAIFFIMLFLILQGRAIYAYAAEEEARIAKGVFIDVVDVSGMTAKEAKAAVDEFVRGLRNKQIAIVAGNNAVYTTLGELDYKYMPNDNIRQALALGTAGNLIRRYKDLKDIEHGKKVYPLTFTIDEQKLSDLIANKVTQYNAEPVNATVTRKNGAFIYTDHVNGSRVNVEATLQAVRDAIFNNWNRLDIAVNAVMEEVEPIYTRDVVELCNTILGTFTTEYKDSAEGRAANLANGARLLNNTVLYPGEVFSACEYLTPFSAENGYYVAGAYRQGKVIDSVGGGACQVTTTLYNAALFAELEIVERYPHSMTVSYVEVSRDAAISENVKDLKIRNNTDAPILIETYTKDRRITFNIWGHETRDTVNRRLEFETRILSETAPPPDVIEKDPTKPEGYRKVTQSAHRGYKAELYKIVYENNVEVSRTRINTSSYSAEPRYVTIGTKVEKPKESKQAKPKEQDNSIESQSTTNNRTNPDGQIQQDIIRDPALNTEENQGD